MIKGSISSNRIVFRLLKTIYTSTELICQPEKKQNNSITTFRVSSEPIKDFYSLENNL